LKKELDEILLRVQKPARYMGNEVNMTKKDPDKVNVRVALCFPDIYEIGMSHLGIRILYHVMNMMEDVYCERAFTPFTDMEQELVKNHIPLFSLETRSPLSAFDFLGFTLQYELSYTNVLNMLKLSDIPVLSCDRTDEHPLVMAGGPCASNPEPLSEIMDFFVIGESEEAIVEILEAYKDHKEKGSRRRDFLLKVSSIEGVYVPSRISGKVKKRIIKDLDASAYPLAPIVPYMQIVHDRAVLELFRGCIRGCRFCQAGYIYRPVREKNVDVLLKQAEETVKSTGYEEISLASLSTSDYSKMRELCEGLLPSAKKNHVNLSLPSLRVDSFSLELLKSVQNDRKSGLTFAPEAGTQRLRDVINKGICEEDIIDSAGLAFRYGYRTIKLYFMLGLPTETMEDVEGISLLVDKIIEKYRETTGRRSGLVINVSTAFFVPKPFTPFQWEAQESMDGYLAKTELLKKKLNRKFVHYSWHDPRTGYLEALLARGDRKVGRVIIEAFNRGCKLDAWNEFFDFESWMEACAKVGVDPEWYVRRERDVKEELPWDIVDIGVSKEFFIKERMRAYREEQTVNCREGCADCGLLSLGVGECVKR